MFNYNFAWIKKGFNVVVNIKNMGNIFIITNLN